MKKQSMTKEQKKAHKAKRNSRHNARGKQWTSS